MGIFCVSELVRASDGMLAGFVIHLDWWMRRKKDMGRDIRYRIAKYHAQVVEV